MRAGRVAFGLVGALFVLVSSACTAGRPDEGASAAPPSVIVPGRPGEAAGLVPRDQANQLPRDDAHNEADVRYVRMMIIHHRQALEMTELVPQRSLREDLRGLAARIADSQQPEIKGMEAWLRQRGQQAPGATADHHGQHGGHQDQGATAGDANMPGMATAEQLAALRAAGGAEFDRLFLQLMTAHHEGAVTMATEVLSTGADVFVEEMAQDVIATQTDEIARMKTMRTG